MQKKIFLLILVYIGSFSLVSGQDSLNTEAPYDSKIGIFGGAGNVVQMPYKFSQFFGFFFEQQYKNNWKAGNNLSYLLLSVKINDTLNTRADYINLTPYIAKGFLKNRLTAGVGVNVWILNNAKRYVTQTGESVNQLDSVRTFKDIWSRSVYGANFFLRYDLPINRRWDISLMGNINWSLTKVLDPIFKPIDWDFNQVGAYTLNIGLHYKLYTFGKIY